MKNTTVNLTVTIDAHGPGHVTSGDVLIALEKLLDQDLVVTPRQSSSLLYRATVGETLVEHHVQYG